MSCQEITCYKCGKIYCSCDICPCQLVDDVIAGKYGNGEERKRQLGNYYNAVQNRVNEKLGYPKRYPEY